VSIDRLKGQIQGIDLLVDPMEKLSFAYQNFFHRHRVCFGRMRDRKKAHPTGLSLFRT
jgi:hypothetical protein